MPMMNHSVVVRDFKGNDALDEFSYFIVFYIASCPRFLVEMLPKFYFIFSVTPEFPPILYDLVLFRGSKIQGCYRMFVAKELDLSS